MEFCYSRPRSGVPSDCERAIRRLGVRPSEWLLLVNIAEQRLRIFRRSLAGNGGYGFVRQCLASTSKFGIGQVNGSNQTPLGLHRVARKVGAGQPLGTVFKSRQPIGLTWKGLPQGTIVHRILWLEGLEPGFNRGGEVDTYRRYVYIHGFGDELTLGRPQSHGCVHLAACDLIPLFDQVREGTLVWIAEREQR